MREPKNKLTIPVKNRRKLLDLGAFKASLEKQLPRLVYIDESGDVALHNNQREKQRIGRVLPNGQASQELSFLQNGCVSDTFVSCQLDQENYFVSPRPQRR